MIYWGSCHCKRRYSPDTANTMGEVIFLYRVWFWHLLILWVLDSVFTFIILVKFNYSFNFYLFKRFFTANLFFKRPVLYTNHIMQKRCLCRNEALNIMLCFEFKLGYRYFEYLRNFETKQNKRNKRNNKRNNKKNKRPFKKKQKNPVSFVRRWR